MKWLFFSFWLALSVCPSSYAADVKISDLPLGVGSATGVNDSFPYVDAAAGVTRRLDLSDLINVPTIANHFAPLFNPVFTGTVTAPTFIGAVTGTSSGNLTLSVPHQYGVLISGTANATSAIIPNASTAFPLVSGGASANPVWSLLTVAGGGTGASTFTSNGILFGNGTSAVGATAAGSQYQIFQAGSSGVPTIDALHLDQAPAVTGILPNSNTTATAANTVSTIMARDGSGQVAATTFTGALSGNATTATTAGNVSGIVAPLHGGTGQDFSGSTGLIKDAAGTFSAATLVDADVSASAAIARSKIAAGTTAQVVYNDVSTGLLTSEAQLAETRGGTGISSTATFPGSGIVATVPSSGVVHSNGSVLSSSNVDLTSQVTGTLPLGNGGTGQTTKTAAFDGLSPTTTKGDLSVYNGTNNVRQAVGSNGQVLTADSTQSTGVKWASAGSSTAPNVQTFTSGSGTYTTPTSPSPLYLVVEMVGGGGGGASSGTGSLNSGSGGTVSTFGTSFLTANGGAGGNSGGARGGTGGTATIGAGATGIAMTGNPGCAGINAGIAPPFLPGGCGGSGPWGGAGRPGADTNAGSDAAANSGAGGGGAGMPDVSSAFTGSGGGSGGYTKAYITSSISSTYSYAIGSGGSGGAAGTSGSAGGNGGSGFLIVYAYFQ